MSRPQTAPRECVVDGHWPDGRIDEPGARYVQLIVQAVVRESDARGWSQRELARRAGVSRRTVDYLINGATTPDVITLAALEVALGTTLLPADRLA